MSSESRWIPLREELNLIRLTLRDLGQRVESVANRLWSSERFIEEEFEEETPPYR